MIIVTHLNLIWLAKFSKARSNHVRALPSLYIPTYIYLQPPPTPVHFCHQICKHLPSPGHPPANPCMCRQRHMHVQIHPHQTLGLSTLPPSFQTLLNHAAVLGQSLTYWPPSRWNSCGQKLGGDSLPRQGERWLSKQLWSVAVECGWSQRRRGTADATSRGRWEALLPSQ